ncbi:hypothetical protein NADFUDRAFT_82055 [Nadsonia fulvescens var. elongata DSM 6958]|uniref:Autophagy-related protein 16 domain-containing protein n=1 Tax=Nadsonia fulvescens var. elongata DSM 6958 TaxID=857566 RepID=A0A1E3PQP6_9ASCO|nr:hypothetical protein NADFUDRAFT_82055 [Nadsonia fulvescens var. elongata DSM 6958]
MSEWMQILNDLLDARDLREKGTIHGLIETYTTVAMRAVDAEKRHSTLSGSNSLTAAQLEIQNTRLRHEKIHLQNQLKSSTREAELWKSRTLQAREEVTERAKAMHSLQDEILSLQIELNVLETKNAELSIENQSLVKRWLAKVQAEAERVNDANIFLESLGRTLPSSSP